jgi:hypothetical protein
MQGLDAWITGGRFHHEGWGVTKCVVCGFRQSIPTFSEYGGSFPEIIHNGKKTAYFEEIDFCPSHNEMTYDDTQYSAAEQKAFELVAKTRMIEIYPWLNEYWETHTDD